MALAVVVVGLVEVPVSGAEGVQVIFLCRSAELLERAVGIRRRELILFLDTVVLGVAPKEASVRIDLAVGQEDARVHLNTYRQLRREVVGELVVKEKPSSAARGRAPPVAVSSEITIGFMLKPASPAVLWAHARFTCDASSSLQTRDTDIDPTETGRCRSTDAAIDP